MFLLLILCLILHFHVCAHAGLTWNSAILIQISEIFKCDLKEKRKNNFSW